MIRIRFTWVYIRIKRQQKNFLIIFLLFPLFCVLKLNGPIRDKELLSYLFFFQPFRFEFWEQHFFVFSFWLIFCSLVRLLLRIRIHGSAFFCGSGSIGPHIFADPDEGCQNVADSTDPDLAPWLQRYPCRSTALVSPSEDEYELILTKIRNLMEEGRGETIFEVCI